MQWATQDVNAPDTCCGCADINNPQVTPFLLVQNLDMRALGLSGNAERELRRHFAEDNNSVAEVRVFAEQEMAMVVMGDAGNAMQVRTGWLDVTCLIVPASCCTCLRSSMGVVLVA